MNEIILILAGLALILAITLWYLEMQKSERYKKNAEILASKGFELADKYDALKRQKTGIAMLDGEMNYTPMNNEKMLKCIVRTTYGIETFIADYYKLKGKWFTFTNDSQVVMHVNAKHITSVAIYKYVPPANQKAETEKR